jgi:hypothetical protein
MSELDEPYRQLLEAAVKSLPSAPPADRFHGRGIVLCAGGDVYFPCAWICISLLRRHGCTLPIELWYRGRREMTDQAIGLLAELGVSCVDAREVGRRENYGRLDTWEIKAIAIAHSRFEEVLYLDADSAPLRNPEHLFESDAYLRHGALFWPDRYAGRGRGMPWLKRETWAVCGVPFRPEPEIEAGQLVVDKSRCWSALALTLFFNGHSDYYYRFFFGDKDTFHLAWRRLGQPYALVPHPPLDLGHSEGMLQHDLDGAPLFEHRCADKWSLSRPNRSIPGFSTEAVCRELLEQLRERWSPPMRGFPAELSPIERDAYERFRAQRVFLYSVEREPGRRVELLPDFRVGDGDGGTVACWMVEEDLHGEMTLSVGPQGSPAFLRQQPDGSWRGRAFRTYHRSHVEISLF